MVNGSAGRYHWAKTQGIIIFNLDISSLRFESPNPCPHNGLCNVPHEVSSWSSMSFTPHLPVYYSVLNYLSDPLEYELMTEYNCESIHFVIIEHLYNQCLLN